MTMVSMKLTPSEASEDMGGCTPCDGDMPVYPWGLSLSLEDTTLTKLGIETPPAVGTKMMLNAMVEVVQASQQENQDGKEICVRLQITDMSLKTESKPSGASLLYPNSSMS
jgi:hypothetical protein